MIEIWSGGQQIGTFKSTLGPKVGDVVEVEQNGKVEPFEVMKLYNYFDVHGEVGMRMQVHYCGNSPGAFSPSAEEGTGGVLVLQDRSDLMELAARAARMFDENDAEGYADCFIEEGLYESPRIGLQALGRAQLMDMCRGREGEDLHFCTNFEIDLRGDEATVRSSLLLSSRTGPLVNTTGHYVSECVRTPQGWRYKQKVSYLDRRG